MKKVRGDEAIRVVSDPNAKLRRIAIGAGMATPQNSSPEIDVVIGGEQREADGGQDRPAYTMEPLRSVWIMTGHNMSEEEE